MTADAGDRTMERRLPDFIIVGAMRAGTTSMTRYLGRHPQVFMSPVKEIHFFDRHHDRGVAWYCTHFREAAPDQVAGESTPMYSYAIEAMDRMAATCPEARLVFLLRDPVDRAYSHYCHNVQRGRDRRTFEEAVRHERDSAAEPADHRLAYVARSRYATHLRALLRRYPSDALHVALFEELLTDPHAVYARVCRFIGVDDAHVPENIGQRTNAPLSIRSVWVRDRARHLPPPLRNALGRLNSTPRDNPPLAESTRHELAELLAPEVEALRREFGIDVSRWRSGW